MATKKITELTALAAPSSDDVLAVVDSPAASPATKKATVAALVGAVSSALGTTVAAGKVFIGSTGTSVPTWMTAGSTASYLKAGASAGELTWVARQWGVSVGWAYPASGDVYMFEVPYNMTVSSFAIVGDSAGTVAVEVRKAALSCGSPSSAAQISSAQPIALANAKSNSSDISSWSDVAWTKGELITLYVNGPSSLSNLTVSLSGVEDCS